MAEAPKDSSASTGGLSQFTTAHACAVVVFLAMFALFLIRRGFHGVNVGGASVSVG